MHTTEPSRARCSSSPLQSPSLATVRAMLSTSTWGSGYIECFHALAEHLLRRPAIQALGALVPETYGPVEVADHDGVLRAVQQRGLLAYLDDGLPFGLLAALALQPGAQADDAEGQVVGKLLQQLDFIGAEVCASPEYRHSTPKLRGPSRSGRQIALRNPRSRAGACQ